LRVGGTGKSPFVEYLLNNLTKMNIPSCTLSRGYGRKTKGILKADSESNPETIGDESLQYFRKFGNQVSVFVGENRNKAINEIISKEPMTKVIVLDDAFQHRSFNSKYKILLTEYKRPFVSDFVLPLGRLRENRKGAKRANCVLVTKCNSNLSEMEIDVMKNRIKPYLNQNTPIFFTTISYSEPKPIFELTQPFSSKKHIILLSGIDNPEPFFTYCKTHFSVSEEIEFPDHHDYSESEIISLINKAKNDTLILTTEKDSTRLLKYQSIIGETPIYYLPIQIAFLKSENKFQELLTNWLNN